MKQYSCILPLTACTELYTVLICDYFTILQVSNDLKILNHTNLQILAFIKTCFFLMFLCTYMQRVSIDKAGHLRSFYLVEITNLDAVHIQQIHID